MRRSDPHAAMPDVFADPFPDPRLADENGIVCAGGVPHPELLKIAYAKGIFPWPHEGYPLLWFSPDPRFVLEPRAAHLHRSLRKAMRRTTLEIRADTAFAEVMAGCARAPRPGQRGTWITPEMRAGYTALHTEGVAHSVEAWSGDRLVGGLYGVSLGGAFFGESMFATVEDASKIAFATLLANLRRWDIGLVDCQQKTDHLARFGATEWPRARFLHRLEEAMRAPTRRGPWRIEVGPVEAAASLEEARGPDGPAVGG